MQPMTLAQRLADARLMTAHKAIVATLGPLFPGVDVVRHPGRVDLTDLLEKQIFRAPTIAVAATRVRVSRELAGQYECIVEWTGYLIVEDQVVGGRRIERDEIAHALGVGILNVLDDPQTARWGLDDISDPALSPQPEYRPIFAVRALEQGVALYGVTWTQTLYALGAPLWDFASPPPDDLVGGVYLPGDPQPEETP